MKPTKKIIAQFIKEEESLLKTYEEFNNRPSARNLSALSMQWGNFSMLKETFDLNMKMTIGRYTEILFKIQDYAKDILIY